MVEETFEPGMTVSLVARRHGVAPNQLFTWRRLVAQGGLTAAGSGEEVGSVQNLSHIWSGDGFGLRDLRLIERPHVHVALG